MTRDQKQGLYFFALILSVMISFFFWCFLLVLLGLGVYRGFFSGPHGAAPGAQPAWDIIGYSWPTLLVAVLTTLPGWLAYRSIKTSLFPPQSKSHPATRK